MESTPLQSTPCFQNSRAILSLEAHILQKIIHFALKYWIIFLVYFKVYWRANNFVLSIPLCYENMNIYVR
jgi:hypothetical protein